MFLTLPLIWTLFLDQLDGLVVLGMLGLPVLSPLALLKPQVSIFAFLARRSLISRGLWGPVIATILLRTLLLVVLLVELVRRCQRIGNESTDGR